MKNILLLLVSLSSLLILNSSCWFFFVAASQPCSAPMIPSDLEIISSVQRGDSRGLHLQGVYGLLNAKDDYNTDVTIQSMTHSIDLPQIVPASEAGAKAWFRMSISPNAFNTKLFLYDVTNGKDHATLLQSSISGGGSVEQMLFYVFESTKKYRVLIGYNLGWNALREGCPSVIIELALQDHSMIPHFSGAACMNLQPPKIGLIDPRDSGDSNLYFKFHQEAPSFASIGVESSSSSSTSSSINNNAPFEMIASYDIVIPHLPGRHQKWKFRSAVHANFIDGGDISLVLMNSNFTTFDENSDKLTTPEGCARGDFDCSYAHRSLKNTAILQQELMAGNNGQSNEYRLFLVRRRAERILGEKLCFPYSLSVDLFPLPSQDTFINCEADLLTETFNNPGIYNNNTGIMRYHTPVLVNLTNRVQKARIMTTKPKSIMRAWISAHRTVDADIFLWAPATESTAPIAYSMSSYHPDGFVAELKGGVEYTFEVSLASTHKKDEGVTDLEYSQLCDFFELQVHVFPVIEGEASNSEDDDYACSAGNGNNNLPYFKDIAEKVKNTLSGTDAVPIYETGVTSYNFWPYTYTIDRSKPIKQEVIAEFQLTFTKAALIAMTISADSYHGTPIIEMSLVGGDPTEILYSRHRSIGSYIYANLEVGVYNIKILTPYTQTETVKTWKDTLPNVPGCIKFNFHLSLGDSGDCIAAIPAPYHITKPGGAHHHHFGDIFRIKPFATEHDISISTPVDSIVHFQSDESTSDISVDLVDAYDTKRVIQTGIVVSSKHQLHGKMVELFAGIAAGKQYTLRIKFSSGTSRKNNDYCRRFAMELSVTPVPPTPQVGSVNYQCEEASGVQDFGTLELPADANEIDVWKPNQMKGPYIVQFKLDQAAHIRMTMLYDFTADAPAMKLCPCTSPTEHWCESECVTADLFMNGLEIPTTTLLPGTYTILLRGWPAGIGSEISGDVAKITTQCHRFHLHLALEPFTDKPTPSMCPVRMQYLPRDLNDVGMLSAYYNNQLHFLQELKLNAKRGGDKTTFRIESADAIIRVQIGQNNFGIGADLLAQDASSGKFKSVDYAYEGSSIYALVKRGTYQLIIDYIFLERSAAAIQQNGCVSVPIEVSIIPASDVQSQLSTSPSICEETPFPTSFSPVHEASVMMTRSPLDVTNKDTRFDKKIDFHVKNSIGAFVNADLMFSFEAGALQMSLTGSELIGDNNYALNRTFTVTRVPNRAVLDVYLQPGRYTLRIWDPVESTRYKRSLPNVAACTRYSLYLTSTDLSGSSSSPNTPGGSGEATLPPARPGSPPDLSCSYLRYDLLPESLSSSGSGSTSEWSTISGDSFRIPFETAINKQQSIGSEVVNYKIIEIPIKFDVAPGQYVRVWFRTKTVGAVSITVIDPNAGVSAIPIATGKWFGRHTLSVSFMPNEPMNTLQLKIKFVYIDLPQYGTDYNTCFEKRQQTTFELLFSRFPVSHIESMVTCPKDSSAASVLPQSTIDKVTTLHGDYYISADDIKKYLQDRNRYNDDQLTANSGFSVLPTFEHRISVTLPEDNMYIMLFADYNLLVSNFRAYFLFANNNSVLRNNDGNPIGDVDEKYDATLFVHASKLPAGEYTIVIMEANAEHRLQKEAQYCIPFNAEIVVGGGTGTHTKDSTTGKKRPFITAISPRTYTSIDASKPLFIEVTTERQSIRHNNALWLQDSKGDRVAPSSIYDLSEHLFRIVFAASSLQWNWAYKLMIDERLVVTRVSGTPFQLGQNVAVETTTDKNVFVVGNFRTASCGCSEQYGQCAIGGACPCTQSSGAQCFSCESDSFLSDHRQPLGMEGDPLRVSSRICETQHGGWHPTIAPGSHVFVPTTHGSIDPHDNGNHGGGHQIDDTNSSLTKSPPLRFLRRFLGFSALVCLAVYVAVLLWNYRKQLQQHAHNPFRMLSNGDEDELGTNTGTNSSPRFGFNSNSHTNNINNNTGALDMDEEANAVHEGAQ